MAKWKKVGSSVYMKGDHDSFVWREGREWFRTDLPPFSMRMALGSVGLSPLGVFSDSRGPYKTMRVAQRGR